MDMESLKTLLPEAEENTLEAILTQHNEAMAAAGQEKAALEAQLSQLTMERAVDRAMAGTKFSSKAARDYCREKITAAGLPLEHGALTGAAEFLAALRKEDPGAFLQERPKVKVAAAAAPGASGAGSALRKAFGI